MNAIKSLFLTLLISGAVVISGSKIASEPVKVSSPETGVYVVDIDTGKCPDCIQPYISDSLETVESVGEKAGALAAINAGFFDPTNTKTTSYIIKNKELVADPTSNPHLMENPKLAEYLPQILDRSEFRIEDCVLNCGNHIRLFDITPHNQLTDKCEIIHSIQAGPELVPELRLQEEAFVVKKDGKVVKQSAGALGKYARTAIAIKGDHVLLIAVSNDTPMTLEGLSTYLKTLNVDKAMAFDGGSSTSLYVNMPDSPKIIVTSAKDNSARRVKSILLVKYPEQ